MGAASRPALGLPVILRRPQQPLNDAASALRGLAWTLSIPLGLPAIGILCVAVIYFPFVFAYEGLGALFGSIVWSMAFVAIAMAVGFWALLVWPLNVQYAHLVAGRQASKTGLRFTGWTAVVVAPLGWALFLLAFFANLPFQALALGAGLSVAACWLLYYGLRLLRAA